MIVHAPAILFVIGVLALASPYAPPIPAQLSPAPSTFANMDQEVRGSFSMLHLGDADLRARRFAAATLSQCEIGSNDVIRGTTLTATTFRECVFHDTHFATPTPGGPLVSDVRFIDCSASELVFDGGVVSGLVFERGTIDRLEIRRAQVDHVEIIGANIRRLVIVDCQADSLVISRGTRVGSISVEGGTLARLDVAGVDVARESLEFSRVKLLSARLSREQCGSVDLSGGITHDQGFRLLQEIEAQSGFFGDQQIAALYADAEQSYNALAGSLEHVSLRGPALEMRYRAAVCGRGSAAAQYSAPRHAFDYVWGEYLRGKYGTSWVAVLVTAMVIWLCIAAVVWALGWLRIACMLEFVATPDGQMTQQRRPKLVLPYGGRSFVDYLSVCSLFSIESMFSLGGRVFSFGTVSELIKPVPRRLVAVGVGRLVALCQAILGLVLVVNFIQAFVASF